MLSLDKTLIRSTLFCFTGLISCSPEQTNLEKLYCFQSIEALYTAWGITKPSLPCPYSESDRRNAKLIFSDGTSLEISSGFYGNGGVYLQDMNCNQTSVDGLLTYIL